jgi:hypothetical protein
VYGLEQPSKKEERRWRERNVKKKNRRKITGKRGEKRSCFWY